MSWSDDALSSAYRRSRPGDPAAESCPDEEVLEGYLLGNLDRAQRDRFADHLESCSSCAGLVQELGRLAPWAEEAAEAVRPRRRRPFFRTLPAVAAVLLLAVAGSLIWSRLADQRTPMDDVRRSPATAVTPPAGAVVTAAPTTFDWPDQPGAAGYRLRLFGPRAELLWESDELAASRTTLPADVIADLGAGHRYSWSVEVTGPARHRELGPFGFEIEPR